MANFAVIEGTKIVNTIVADSKAIAEEATGKTCIEYTTESAEPGGSYIDGKFIQIQPFPSWTLNFNSYIWEAPVAMPIDEKSYRWDEATTSWTEIQP